MPSLKDTKLEGGKSKYTFEVEKVTMTEIVYTEDELTAQKERLERRITSTNEQLQKDQTELDKINTLIELTNG